MNDRERLANIDDVVNSIKDNIHNEFLVNKLIDKVYRYMKSKKDKDDLTNQEADAIYYKKYFSDLVQLSKKRKLNILWTGHSKYRSELKDIDYKKMNQKIVDRMHDILTDPKKKKKDQKIFKEPGVGHVVLDYDLTERPSKAEIVTVYAKVKDMNKKQARSDVVKDSYGLLEEIIKDLVKSGRESLHLSGGVPAPWDGPLEDQGYDMLEICDELNKVTKELEKWLKKYRKSSKKEAVSLSEMSKKMKQKKQVNDKNRQKFLPDVDDFESFVSKMTDAQKAYADQYDYDERFTSKQQRQLSSMRNLDWKGKYKSARAFMVEMRKAVVEYNRFTAVNMIKVAKRFSRYKYCLARESSVAVYVKGFKDAEEVVDIAKAFKKIGADEISLVKGNSTLWAEWANKIYGLEEYADVDLKDYELKVWWD